MKLIGISGLAGSGKDTAGDLLIADYTALGYRCTRLSFAKKLKEACQLLYGWDLDRLSNDPAYKEGDRLDDGSPDPACELLGMTRRVVMQKMGTECFRVGMHPDHWIIVTKLAILNGEYDEYDIGFITDCRFPNELNFVRSMGGILLRVEGSTLTTHTSHASEVEWQKWTDWDITVRNRIDPDLPVQVNREAYRQLLRHHVDDFVMGDA